VDAVERRLEGDALGSSLARSGPFGSTHDTSLPDRESRRRTRCRAQRHGRQGSDRSYSTFGVTESYNFK
jgi:hypothetical protein